MCDMPIKKRMTEKRRERGGGGAREYNAVEVEIYSGIGFTRFHQGPIPPPPISIKEHMVQINSCQQREQREEGKEGKGIGQRQGKTRKEEISGIAVRSEECSFS